jgi:hypothetical protein
MSDSKSGGFPWASVAVLVAFVTSTQLVPHAFEQLRPAEKERAQAATAADLEVEARLWEDPFVAVRRHEAERLERCDKLYKDAARATDCKLQGVAAARKPAELARRLDGDGDHDLSETLVLVALVPGNAFVGAEEGRRRTRYAVLAGLQAKGYVPDNAERLGLLQLDAEQLSGAPVASGQTPSPGLLLPYELLSASALSAAVAGPAAARPAQAAASVADVAAASRYSQVAVLWVDETALPARKLDALALLLQGVFRPWLKAPEQGPRLAIIGPSNTDALRVALADLRSAAWRRGPGRAARDACRGAESQWPLARPPQGEDPWLQGYWLMSRALMLSPFSTAGDAMLSELDGASLEDYVAWRFCRLQGGRQDPPVRLTRKISSDDQLLKQLTAELRLRLPAAAPRRIVLVGERDSLYAQALVGQLRSALAQDPQLQLEELYFFRGLDGVTTRDASREEGRGGAAKGEAQARIEWPEARDQLDYLRRLAQQLKRSEAKRDAVPIGAIGLMASDVHDKLLLLQALHESFADKVFFTTDLDARFLHPRTQAFTRNLLVSSSLPLEFPRQASARCQAVAQRVGLPPPDLAAGNPPWRDVYQSSTYLAARHAGCRSKACRAVEQCAAQEAQDHPSLYEIGRNSAVALDGYAFERQIWTGGNARRLLGLGLLALLLVAALGWPGAPSLLAALRSQQARHAASTRLGLAETLFAALHVALLVASLACVLELMRPGSLGVGAMAALGLGSALMAALWCWPQHRFGLAAAALPTRPVVLASRALLLAGLMVLWWTLWWRTWSVTTMPCRDCEPALWLEGVSAWPTQLLHLLALACMVHALDASWARAPAGLREDGAWLGLPQARERRWWRGGLALLGRAWWPHFSVPGWRAEAVATPEGGVNLRRLWHQYARRSAALPRALRVLCGYGLTLGLVLALFLGFSDGSWPELPVRGVEHRRLVGFTLALALLLLPLVVVAVADATMLSCRFIRLLSAGRSLYPSSTVQRFAAALGSQHAVLWATPIAMHPGDRGRSQGLHSLLDDWMDVQLVARRSARVTALVIAPFVVLALMIVGRSRLFDNWSLTLPIAVAVSAYLLGAVVLALLLKQAAEQAREQALRSMAQDLRWLAGESALKELQEPFKRLMAAVEAERRGAFAAFFDQPLLKALLVPLGGAGGAQLIEYFLLAR